MEHTLTLTDWILLGLFCFAGFYAVVGNLVLFFITRSRGEMPSALGGVAVLYYFTLSRDRRSRGFDIFALSVLFSLAVVILVAILLYPRVWA